jgi:hypothetical protein
VEVRHGNRTCEIVLRTEQSGEIPDCTRQLSMTSVTQAVVVRLPVPGTGTKSSSSHGGYGP